MFIDNNLIAYEYYKNLYVPKEVYTSGKKDETEVVDKYSPNAKTLAVLTLEEDIVDSNGRGLLRGFYNVAPDKYTDFLLIFQSGKLKAKVPVFEMNVLESLNPQTEQKVKKMSLKKYYKEQEKEKRKYYKGINPAEVEYRKAEIYRLKDENAFVLIYEDGNLEIKGMIKLH